ncbi:hypothetical protein [Agrobacterium cavarae]|uniref:hypothetical protein n=1 Tax=Agrobacterium cavarae TaxID=2528239 RepID=UPI0028969F00|nr:hypothetical protein [Agrobacterium cavarae]
MAMPQLEMFGDDARPQVSIAANPDRVRRKLNALLVEIREAGDHGLPGSRRRLIETIVPQMTRWLPQDEAEEIRRKFGEWLAA